MSGNKTLLIGYYGFDNLGDECILMSILEQYGAAHCSVLSNQPLKTIKTYQCNAFYRWSLFDVYRAYRTAKLIILGGGGLLQDETSSLSLWYYLLHVWIAKIFNLTIIMNAVGVGPIRSRFNRILISITLKNVTQISVRDFYSKNLLMLCGVKQKIEIVDDCAKSYINKIFQKENNSFEVSPKISLSPKNNIVYICRNISKKHLKIILNSIAKVCSLYSLQCQILFFQPADDTYRFRKVMERIQQTYNNKKIFLDPFVPDFQTTIRILSHAELVITQRYHGVLFAHHFCRDVIAIGNDPKLRAISELKNQQNGIQSEGLINVIELNKLTEFILEKIIIDKLKNFS